MISGGDRVGGGQSGGDSHLIIRARVCEAKGTVNLCTKCTNPTITKTIPQLRKNESQPTSKPHFCSQTFHPFPSLYIIITLLPSFHPPFQTYVLQHPYQSAIYEIVSKSFEKKTDMFGANRYIGYFLHPLTKRRSALKLTF